MSDYEAGRKAGYQEASRIVMAKHRELADAQRRVFVGKRDFALGVLSQLIKSFRKASS